MSPLVVKGNIVAALPIRDGTYVCMYVKLFSNVFLRIGYIYIYTFICRSIPLAKKQL